MLWYSTGGGLAQALEALSMKGLMLADVIPMGDGVMALAGMGLMRCAYCGCQPTVARCGCENPARVWSCASCNMLANCRARTSSEAPHPVDATVQQRLSPHC